MSGYSRFSLKSGKTTAAILLVAGMVVGALLVSVVQSQSGGGAGEIRVNARAHDDGRVEMGFQIRDADGSWSERQLPERRFLPGEPTLMRNRWYNSTPVTVDAATDSRFTTAATASICWVSHGTDDDIFWATAQQIARATGQRDLGLSRTTIHSEPTTAGQARAIRECVDDGHAVIATTLADPSGLRSAIQYAHDNDVIVTSFNSGIDVATELGSFMHVALDDRASGEALGVRFNEANVSGGVLCVKHEAANVGLDQRCAGIESVYNGGVVTEYDVSDTGVIDVSGSIRSIRAQVNSGNFGAVVVLNQELAEGISSLSGVQTAAFLSDGNGIALVESGALDFGAMDFAAVQGYMALTNAFFAQWVSIVADISDSPPVIIPIEPLVFDRDSVPGIDTDTRDALLGN